MVSRSLSCRSVTWQAGDINITWTANDRWLEGPLWEQRGLCKVETRDADYSSCNNTDEYKRVVNFFHRSLSVPERAEQLSPLSLTSHNIFKDNSAIRQQWNATFSIFNVRRLIASLYGLKTSRALYNVFLWEKRKKREQLSSVKFGSFTFRFLNWNSKGQRGLSPQRGHKSMQTCAARSARLRLTGD